MPQNDKIDFDVYHTAFTDPYTIQATGQGEQRLLFAKMDQVLKTCARQEKKERDEPNGWPTLDMAIILPNNIREHGQSTDAQFLPALAVNTQRICRSMNLNFHIKSRVSWECDDRALKTEINEDIVQHHHLDDLAKFFPGKKKEECITLMKARQAYLLNEAKEILREYNLIVVGSPSVNQVMLNLCDILLTNYDNFAELGMYLFPATGGSPLTLRRYTATREWHEYRERYWPHRNIGWVHMIRNPWSVPGRPRFLIYVGGFYAQGVVAAMRKRVTMSDALVALLSDETMTQEQRTNRLLRNPNVKAVTDYQHEEGSGESCFIPAHIVEAKVEIPFHWFFGAPRPDQETQSWTNTRPSFEGNVGDFEPVLKAIR